MLSPLTEAGRSHLVLFYTVPGDTDAEVRAMLEREIAKALGADFARYELSCKKPWFEPTATSPDTPVVQYLADSVTSVLGREAVITTMPKQDSFVLRSRAGIPTVSFGPARIESNLRCHVPNEYLTISELRDGCCISYSTVLRWLGWQ